MPLQDSGLHGNASRPIGVTEPSSEATGTEQPTKQTRDLFVRGYSARAHGKHNKEAFWDGSEGCLVRCSPVLSSF